MRAILVSVDYSDLLTVTLKYNRHHFDEIMVVTSTLDVDTPQVALENQARVYATDSFYANGAVFNKWIALEEGLDVFGRHGLLCIMDADILWPKKIPTLEYVKGSLYTPLRRMMTDMTQPIPDESEWSRFPLHQQQREWAGYTQIFHADDPVLGESPWYETNWSHAGGSDSMFQMRWREQDKARPGFECLHLGASGENWCGRSTPYLDGTRHPEARERRELVRRFIRGRTSGPSRFDGEKIH